MQNRIDRLEGLVLSLMTNGANSAGPVAAQAALSRSQSNDSPDCDGDEDEDLIKEEDEDSVEQVTDTFGIMRVQDEMKNTQMYMGDTHWAAVLKDIAEVKNYWLSHKDQYEAQLEKVTQTNANNMGGATRGPALLSGGEEPPLKEDLIAALPPKYACDKLVSRYFDSFDVEHHILHLPTFQGEYEHFWRTRNSCPIWMGLLYSIMTLALLSYHRAGDAPPEYRGRCMIIANEYRQLSVKCLIRGEYYKPGPYVLETLSLYLLAEHSWSSDFGLGVWVIVGVMIRLALRMGYHRDPGNYKTISPFYGEMRRRCWMFIQQADILLSFQLGLPSMTRPVECDTALPRNLNDEDLNENMTELPPARPDTERTRIQYLISKARLADVFSRIVANSTTVIPQPYEAVGKLEADLNRERAALPPPLRMRPWAESLQDNPEAVWTRYNLDMLYHKAQCVLHRRYLSRARQNEAYAHSRVACVESSMELLRHQALLHRESQDGGHLCGIRWFVTSVTAQDFLLAAMIICLDLYHGHPRRHNASASFFWAQEHAAMIAALENSRDIWSELRDSSIEAFKAANIITVMLEKLTQDVADTDKMAAEATRGPSTRGPNGLPASLQTKAEQDAQFASFGPELAAFGDDPNRPEHNAAMTLGMLSGGLSPNTQAGLFDRTYPPTPGGLNARMSDAPFSPPSFGMDGLGIGAGLPSASATGGGGDPFSGYFNTAGMMQDMPESWDGWDSYLQGAPTDPMAPFWGGPVDLPTAAQTPAQITAAPADSQQQSQQQQHNPSVDSVFMGVNTPPRNTAM
ncbi:MAG: hypothetical protein M1824_004856 [Vezdaea acicularis]|nr:MAG: hypothetical protein M1824_004856 [Vezdaea acicularis]